MGIPRLEFRVFVQARDSFAATPFARRDALAAQFRLGAANAGFACSGAPNCALLSELFGIAIVTLMTGLVARQEIPD